MLSELKQLSLKISFLYHNTVLISIFGTKWRKYINVYILESVHIAVMSAIEHPVKYQLFGSPLFGSSTNNTEA